MLLDQHHLGSIYLLQPSCNGQSHCSASNDRVREVCIPAAGGRKATRLNVQSGEGTPREHRVIIQNKGASFINENEIYFSVEESLWSGRDLTKIYRRIKSMASWRAFVLPSAAQ
jgi:hypothetical protein